MAGDGPAAPKSYVNANFRINPPQHRAGKSVYPFNKVRKTLTGHQFEEDDTLGNSRLKVIHSSGTQIEIVDEGSLNIQVQNQNYQCSLGDTDIHCAGKFTLTMGTKNSTPDPDEEPQGVYNHSIVCEGNLNINCTGDFNLTARNFHSRLAKDFIAECDGGIGLTGYNMTTVLGAGKDPKEAGQYKLQCGNYSLDVRGETIEKYAKKRSLDIASGGQKVMVKGDYTIHTEAPPLNPIGALVGAGIDAAAGLVSEIPVIGDLLGGFLGGTGGEMSITPNIGNFNVTTAGSVNLLSRGLPTNIKGGPDGALVVAGILRVIDDPDQGFLDMVPGLGDLLGGEAGKGQILCSGSIIANSDITSEIGGMSAAGLISSGTDVVSGANSLNGKANLEHGEHGG